MTLTSLTPETSTSVDQPVPAQEPSERQSRPLLVQPVLEKLFELYPHLFGAEFLPLKLGTFQDLLALHPEVFTRETLKLALSQHTRSARYLQSVVSGQPRHDLQGAVVEPVSPEHVYLALLELFRRRQRRARQDLRASLYPQLIAAFKASGLTRQAYGALVQTHNVDANALLDEAFAGYDQQLAKQEALRRAFDASGKTPAEFAEMYGLSEASVRSVL